MSILDFVPAGYKLRSVQVDMLLSVESAWKDHDIIALRGDVGIGKSLVLRTIAAWQASQNKRSGILTPRVALQDQYKESFKTTPLLKGASRYRCSDNFYDNCSQKKNVEGNRCPACPYSAARKSVAESKVAIFNVQSYVLSQDPREVVLVDEAHTLFDILSEPNTIRLWDCKHSLPKDRENYGDVLVWLEKILKDARGAMEKARAELAVRRSEGWSNRDCAKLITKLEDHYSHINRLQLVHLNIKSSRGSYFIEETKDYYHNKLTKLYQIRPKTLAGLKNPLAMGITKKIILATATIQPVDVEKLGLADKSVKFLNFPSPFDPEDQQIVVDPVGNMSFKYQEKNMPKLAQRIIDTREKHKDTKGLVHVPYGMAKKLQKHLDADWILWHSKEDKESKLSHFMKESPPGTVMIASGMAMGIDLAGPDFGWQAIAKIMYPSMSDNLIKHWYNTEPKWIQWLTVREFIQACGRVNRYMGDKAVTYVWDNCLGNPEKKRFGLWQKAVSLGYISDSFKRRFLW